MPASIGPVRSGGISVGSGAHGSVGARPPITVVGCGNWLDRSDRVGPKVMAALGGRVDGDVELVDVGTSVLGLLDHLHGQELMLLVDACMAGEAPGAVVVREPDYAAPPPRSNLHQVGPLEALAVARELDPERLPACTKLVLIETGGLEERAEEAACLRAVAEVQRQIDAWRVAQRGAGHDDGRGRQEEDRRG